MCKTSKLSPRLSFSKNITNQVVIALENDQSGAENEGIFVPNLTSFALAKVCFASAKAFASGGVFFALANPRPLPCCDSSFTSVKRPSPR